MFSADCQVVQEPSIDNILQFYFLSQICLISDAGKMCNVQLLSWADEAARKTLRGGEILPNKKSVPT